MAKIDKDKFVSNVVPPDPVLTFGEHNGKKCSEVDVKYLDFLIGRDWLWEPLKTEITNHLKSRPEWQTMDDDLDDD